MTIQADATASCTMNNLGPTCCIPKHIRHNAEKESFDLAATSLVVQEKSAATNCAGFTLAPTYHLSTKLASKTEACTTGISKPVATHYLANIKTTAVDKVPKQVKITTNNRYPYSSAPTRHSLT